MNAAVLVCTFPRSSVVVNYNQLDSEIRNVSACFYDVTTRMQCFVLKDSRAQIWKSLEIKVTHFCFCFDSFQCSRMPCTVAHLFFLVSSISAHGSGRDYLDVVSENTPSWHGLCLSCMVIASAAILLLY